MLSVVNAAQYTYNMTHFPPKHHNDYVKNDNNHNDDHMVMEVVVCAAADGDADDENGNAYVMSPLIIMITMILCRHLE